MIYPGGELVDRIGVRLHPTRDDTAILPVSPGAVREGEFLAATLMLAADISSGVRLHDATVAMVLTDSFSLRRAVRPRIGPITATSSALVIDQRRAIDRVEFRDTDGEIVAAGRISFVVRRSPEATPPTKRNLDSYRAEWVQPIQEPLFDAAEINVVDAATGRVEMRATAAVRRKVGMLQGSMVTLLGEASALALAEHHFRAPAVIAALDVDFVNAAHAEQLTTQARWLARPGASDIEVVLRGEPEQAALAVFTIGAVRADSR